jgi:hypothetical protein
MGKEPSPSPSRYLAVVLPAGNNFETDGHARLKLTNRHPKQTLQWSTLPDDSTDSFLELWYPREHADRLRVRIEPPGGKSCIVGVDEIQELFANSSAEPSAATIHLRHASSGNDDAMVLIALAPAVSTIKRGVAPSGVWRITVEAFKPGPKITVNAWVERDDPPVGSGAPPRQSRLLTGALPLPRNAPSPKGSVVQRAGTCNSIANGSRTVVVGACLAQRDGIEFSRYTSEGPTRNKQRAHWPDLVAPGDHSDRVWGIAAAGTRGGVQVRMNGTSVAAPQVSRALIEAFLPYRAPLPVRGGKPVPTPPTHGPKISPHVGDGDPRKSRAGRGRLSR